MKCGPVFQERSQHSTAPVRKLRELPGSSARDNDRLLPLVAETVNEGGSVLVFCGGRAQCQSGAQLVADLLPGFLAAAAPAEAVAKREALVHQLRAELGAFSNASLEKLLLAGKSSDLCS